MKVITALLVIFFVTATITEVSSSVGLVHESYRLPITIKQESMRRSPRQGEEGSGTINGNGSGGYGGGEDSYGVHSGGHGIASATECARFLYDTQCNNSSYAQNYINAVSQCGSLGSSVAIAAENQCRMNQVGDYCGLIAGLDNSLFDTLFTCQEAFPNCSMECHDSLTMLKNHHGCCLNSNMDLKSFFMTCSMAFPTACPPTSIMIPDSTSENPSCTSMEDIASLSLNFLCTIQNIQPVLNALMSNNCDEAASLTEISCSYRNGKYCIDELVSQENSNSASTFINNCLNQNASGCNSRCRNSITSQKNKFGCCLNIFNASDQVIPLYSGAYQTIFDNDLWNMCDIPPPDVCELKLINAASNSPNFMCENIIILVAVFNLFNLLVSVL